MLKPRILIVDDDVNLSGLVALVLRKSGLYEVCVENRSSQALTVAQEFRPDLVLLDVDMPGKDGGVVAAELRSDRALRNRPIIFFTSLVSHAEAGEGGVMKDGSMYLAKPVNSNVLIRVIERVLNGGVPAAA